MSTGLVAVKVLHIELKVSPILMYVITRVTKIFHNIYKMFINWAGTYHNMHLIRYYDIINILYHTVQCILGPNVSTMTHSHLARGLF